MGIHVILWNVSQCPQQNLLDVVSGNVRRLLCVNCTNGKKLNTTKAFHQKNGKIKTNIFNKL